MEKKRIDLLSRNEFIDNVIKLVEQLSENGQGCCFAIEGGWGIGKTFVIEQLEKQLNMLQNENTASDKYFVFHYNCWQYDYYEEPAVAIISAMLGSIQKDKAITALEIENTIKAGWQFAMEKLQEIAGLYIENRIGVNLVSVANDIKNNKDQNEEKSYSFDKMFNFNKTIEQVQDNLKEIAKERTIVLVVDELDRCVPQYTIKVLERIHHIFAGLENIVVILAIDRKQLEHSVEEMFGARQSTNSMSVEKYLKKFIDFSMTLDSGKINDNLFDKYEFYFEKFFFNGELKNKEEIVEVISNLLAGMDIRKQEKLIEKIDIVHPIVCKESVDESVIIFEILYEVLKIWDFGDMKKLALINREENLELKDKLGVEKSQMLQKWGEDAGDYIGIVRKDDMVEIKNNLLGDVFWYFANIYNMDKMPYYPRTEGYENRDRELDVVKRYCNFSEIMN